MLVYEGAYKRLQWWLAYGLGGDETGTEEYVHLGILGSCLSARWLAKQLRCSDLLKRVEGGELAMCVRLLPLGVCRFATLARKDGRDPTRDWQAEQQAPQSRTQARQPIRSRHRARRKRPLKNYYRGQTP